MRRKALWSRGLSVCLAGALALSTAACGVGQQEELLQRAAEAEEKAAEAEETITETVTKSGIVGTSAAQKEETVYVTSDANGGAPNVIVTEWLKNAEGTTALADRSELADIVNVKGDEGYAVDADGTMTWETNGSDIYYQGTSDRPLPVAVKVTYFLNGTETAPADMAGRSGEVKIRFDYQNNERVTAWIGDQEEEIYTPFATISGVMLDADRFTDVAIDHGRVVTNANNYVVVGAAFPGLKDSLKIDEDKLKEDLKDGDLEIGIPDALEITAKTTDFTLPMTLTFVSSDVLSSLGFDDLNNGEAIDKIRDDMDELTDGMRQLREGGDELHDGTGELRDGTGEMKDGAKELDDGALELRDGALELKDGALELKDGAWELRDGVGTLNNGVGTLDNGAQSLDNGAKELDDGAAKLKSGAGELVGGFSELTSGAATLVAGVALLQKTLAGYLDEMEQAIKALATYDAMAMSFINSALSTAGGASLRPTVPGGGALLLQQSAGFMVGAAPLTGAEDLDVQDTGAEGTEATGESGTAEAADETETGEIAAPGTTGAVGETAEDGTVTDKADGDSPQGAEEVVEESVTVDLPWTGSSADDPLAPVKTLSQKLAKMGIENDLPNAVATMSNSSATAQARLDAAVEIHAVYRQLLAARAVLTVMQSTSPGISDLANGASALSAGIEKAGDGASTLYDGTVDLKNGTGSLKNGTKTLKDGTAQLQSGVSELFDGSVKLYDGTAELYDGTVELYDGAVELKDGTTELYDGAVELDDGAGELDDGVQELVDGLIEFDEEGIQKLADAFDGDISEFADRLRAVSDAAKAYKTYGGAKDGADVSVKFIYKTEGIQ